MFSPGLKAIRLDAISTLCPQSDMAEKEMMYLIFRDEQLLAPPAMPMVVPGATVSVPVRMLIVARAQLAAGSDNA